MRVFERNEKGIWLRPNSAEGFFVSRLGHGLSVGREALLTTVDPKDVTAILRGDTETLCSFM